MSEESPSEVLEQLVVADHGKADEDAGWETHIEGEDVDVVSGTPTLAISGFELQGFIFSEIVRTKGLEGQTLSEGVFGTSRPPQCKFSNLQNLPLTFYLEFLCWSVTEFY